MSDPGAAPAAPTPKTVVQKTPASSPLLAWLKRRWLDILLLALLALAALWLAERVQTRLIYQWNWSMIPGYFLFYDDELDTWRTNLLLEGLFTTVRMAIWASIVALILGVIVAFGRVSNLLFIRLLARTYVELVRNLPPLIFIFIFYFFLSAQLAELLQLSAWARSLESPTLEIIEFLFGPRQLLENFISGMLCLALFEAAYVAEIVRAGIQSVDKGQWESATALGLNRRRTLRLVILPQAIRKIMPPLAGQFISLVKDSSIVSLISVQELTFAGQQISIATRKTFEIWLTVAALYFVICFSLSLVSRRIERRFKAAGGR